MRRERSPQAELEREDASSFEEEEGSRDCPSQTSRNAVHDALRSSRRTLRAEGQGQVRQGQVRARGIRSLLDEAKAGNRERVGTRPTLHCVHANSLFDVSASRDLWHLGISIRSAKANNPFDVGLNLLWVIFSIASKLSLFANTYSTFATPARNDG